MSGWGMSVAGLASTIDVLEDLRGQFDGDTLYLVGPTVNYAIYNERGTSKMEARPFMRPAWRRVQANTETHVRRMSSSQGIPLNSEENIVRCAALAVQNQAKKIADRKGVRDTGDLIASITIEQVN